VNRFDLQPLSEILASLTGQLERAPRATVLVPNPDLGAGFYPGERFEHDGRPLVHRPLRVWLDLAERLECRLLLPRPSGRSHAVLTFERLVGGDSWRRRAGGTDKYGATSPFQRVDKLEEARFLIDYREALARVPLVAGARALSLGVNRGDELAALRDYAHAQAPEIAGTLHFVGVDRSESALELARERFPEHRFLTSDLARLEELELDRFDLVLSLSTLQSPGVDDRALLRMLIQRHLEPRGSLILSLPNGRYLDGELLYGARMVNFSQVELSLIIKDLAFYRKYLHQHHFKVFITGKYELFLTAVRD